MTRRQRLRRVALLCLHFLRNLAFYKAGYHGRAPKRKTQFWVSANANFLDHCVLEFCKLYGEPSGRHYWQKVVTDQAAFQAGLLVALRITSNQLDAYIDDMRTYRDKFIAHLDLDEVMHIPYLRKGRKAVSYLYNYLRTHEDEGGFFANAPDTAKEFYSTMAVEGNAVYRSKRKG